MYKLKFRMLKVFMGICLAVNMFRVYAYEEQVFCYPEDISQRFNGKFFSYSHINLKDYVGDRRFANIPDEVKLAPANQQIPTFWFKMDAKKVTDEGKPADAAATYGYSHGDGVFEWEPGTKIYGTDKRANNNASWIFELDDATNKATVTYDRKSLRLICNRGDGSSKPLKEFKFHPEDTYSLPVRFANDFPPPQYRQGTLPIQEWNCKNKKDFPRLEVSWTVDRKTRETYIKLNQLENDESGSYPFKSKGEYIWKVAANTVISDYSRGFLNGLILGLSADSRVIPKIKNNVKTSEVQIILPKVDLIMDSLSDVRRVVPKDEVMKKFYDTFINSIQNYLEVALTIQRTNVYKSDYITPVLRNLLVTKWTLTLTDEAANERKFPLLCAPTLYLPWEGNTIRDDNAVVVHTHDSSTTADGEHKNP
ncbi:MAG: hypothetical protein K0R14_1923 [Burkholderiales bacterium]|jgi:hypothetical protein|nr:hypothetical protein [Burkholderiales bacterium]